MDWYKRQNPKQIGSRDLLRTPIEWTITLPKTIEKKYLFFYMKS